MFRLQKSQASSSNPLFFAITMLKPTMSLAVRKFMFPFAVTKVTYVFLQVGFREENASAVRTLVMMIVVCFFSHDVTIMNLLDI